MSLSSALSRFPKDSQFRGIIRELANSDVKRRNAACDKIQLISRIETWQDARTCDWKISEPEALAIFSAYESLVLPTPELDWRDGAERLLGLFWRSPYPSLVEPCKRVYAKHIQPRRRCAILALLGTIATREAAEAFMCCIRDHGWPEHGYPRVFEELEKLLKFSDVMLPDVMLTDGPWTTYVGDALLGATAKGWLDFAQVGGSLEQLAPFTLKKLQKALRSATKRQQPRGIAWRFDEKYWSVRNEVCMFLDLAGWLKAPELTPILRDATGLADPRIAAFAATSLVRRGQSVGTRVLNRIAACHETRGLLFQLLSAMSRADLFPAKWRTWEAFGAARMVEWLMYPAELGREPDEIHLEQTEPIGPRRNKTVIYVWKFRNRGEQWLAGVSGPHKLTGQPQPVDGQLTFSRFEEWSAASPLEHIERCAGTVSDFLNPPADE